jgi:hypothetical protein
MVQSHKRIGTVKLKKESRGRYRLDVNESVANTRKIRKVKGKSSKHRTDINYSNYHRNKTDE